MRTLIVLRRTALVVALLVVPLACDSDESPTDPGNGGAIPASIAISGGSRNFQALRDSTRLTATVKTSNGDPLDDAEVTWSSTDTTVVRVRKSGWVVAHGNGEVDVVATAGEVSDTVSIEVKQVVVKILIAPDSIVLGEGKTGALLADLVDSNDFAVADGVGSVVWSSEDQEVARVEELTGKITAMRAGGVTRLKVRWGELDAEARIRVLDQIVIERQGKLVLINDDGSDERLLSNHAGGDYAPVWSLDGSKIAFHSDRDGQREIYVMAADGGNQKRLTTNSADDSAPAWSPDGSKIAFLSTRDGRTEIYSMDPDGGNQTRLTDVDGEKLHITWSPPGNKIVYTCWMISFDICAVDAIGGRPINLTQHAAWEEAPAISPSGSKIAYHSNRNGQFEIYLLGPPLTNLTNHWGDDYSPVWSPDGSKIAFVSNRDDDYLIYLMNADGTGQSKLTYGVESASSPAWSEDGSWILFSGKRDGVHNIFKVSTTGHGTVKLTNSNLGESFAAWRPRPK
jgi:tricorn protease-like protein